MYYTKAEISKFKEGSSQQAFNGSVELIPVFIEFVPIFIDISAVLLLCTADSTPSSHLSFLHYTFIQVSPPRPILVVK